MILTLAKRYNVDLRRSYFIGSSDTDILSGKLANLKTIFINNGKYKNYQLSIKPSYIVKDLYGAVNLVLRHKK